MRCDGRSGSDQGWYIHLFFHFFFYLCSSSSPIVRVSAFFSFFESLHSILRQRSALVLHVCRFRSFRYWTRALLSSLISSLVHTGVRLLEIVSQRQSITSLCQGDNFEIDHCLILVVKKVDSLWTIDMYYRLWWTGRRRNVNRIELIYQSRLGSTIETHIDYFCVNRSRSKR